MKGVLMKHKKYNIKTIVCILFLLLTISGISIYFYLHPSIDRLTNYAVSNCQKEFGENSQEFCKCAVYRGRVILSEDLFKKVVGYIEKDGEMASALLMQADPILGKRLKNAIYDDCHDSFVKIFSSQISQFREKLIDIVAGTLKNEKEEYVICANNAIRDAINAIPDEKLFEFVITKKSPEAFFTLLFGNTQFGRNMRECKKLK